MRSKRLLIALIACVAFAAVAANAAQAGWTITTSPEVVKTLKTGESERVTVDGKNLTLTGTVTGIPVTLEAETVECTTTVICKIEATATDANHSSGSLTFTGVKIVSPSNCNIKNSTINTEPLTDTIKMGAGTTANSVYDTFFPENTENVFASFEIVQGSAKTCALPIEQAIKVKGSVVGKAELATGKHATNQELTFSKAITQEFNTTTGATDKLTLGTAEAFLTGTVVNWLESDLSWGDD